MKKLLFCFSLVLFLESLGQSSIHGDLYQQNVAYRYFQEGNYQSAFQLLGNKERSSIEEPIYLISGIKSNQAKKEDLEDWVEANDKHAFASIAFYHLGSAYFYDGDSLKAQKYLSKAKANEIPASELGFYGLMAGLINLKQAKYGKARKMFSIAKDNGFSKNAEVIYYDAFAAYHLTDYEDALEGLELVKEDSQFGTSSKYFLAKMLLQDGLYDEVLNLAKLELSNEKTVTNAGFHQLLGETFALRNNIGNAEVYFQKAIDLHPSEPSAALFYQAGVAKFKTGKEDQAIEYLTKSGIKGGDYAQLSAFQLGRLFLKKKQYEKALPAYVEASVSSDADIRAESLSQAAKINGKLDNFSEAINYSNDYLKGFPNGEWSQEMKDLIAESYLRTSNYDLAIKQLKEVGVISPVQKSIYQKVTYQKAVLTFNDASFLESKSWFNESLKYQSDRTLADGAFYHLAEIAMREERYDAAIISYKNQRSLDPLSNYGIAYAYYNQQEYQEAIPYFRSVGTVRNSQVQLDAKVRLADCLYATKDYQAALSKYNDAGAQTNSSYITYQKGLVLQNLGKGDEALQALSQVFESPRFADKAIFQSAMIYFSSARFAEAEVLFSKLIREYPSSENVVESYLNRGVSRRNLAKQTDARTDFTFILENHISSSVAINAILGLQELEQDGLEVRELEDYISRYKEANPDDGSLKFVEFEAAKRLYFNFSYVRAAESFEKYLNEYPSSDNKREAQYYLADAYYRSGNLEAALESFNEIQDVRNTFTGRVLSRLGGINLTLGDSVSAQNAYLKLNSLGLSQKDTYNALRGLMQLNFEQEQYGKAIERANEILFSEWKPLNAVQEATLIKAKSYLFSGRDKEAEEQFLKISNGTDVFGAEANYYLGLIKYEADEHDGSLETLFNLNSKYGSYQAWVDRSYLLIAKNYLGKEEVFQAKATLRSIIQHSQNEQIVQESEMLLNEIENQSTPIDSLQNEK